MREAEKEITQVNGNLLSIDLIIIRATERAARQGKGIEYVGTSYDDDVGPMTKKRVRPMAHAVCKDQQCTSYGIHWFYPMQKLSLKSAQCIATADFRDVQRTMPILHVLNATVWYGVPVGSSK